MEIGIVGLPNVGKSTLFNALLKRQQAFVANYPFATIEPNIGIVPVPDERLAKLAEVVHTEKIVPATVKFVDIAGLVKGASQGEGLGNKFLAHIREVDAIVYVLRGFSDENVIKAGSMNPQDDLEILQLELELAGIKKPEIKVLNVDEDKIVPKEGYVVLSAKLEAELGDEVKDLGIVNTGLEQLIKKAYEILGLQSFLTAGEKEVRAWTIKNGTKAAAAAGVIHTDFEKHFIKADVINWQEFVELGGWQKAREAGKVRMEGRDYMMQEGDVVEFKVGV